MLPPPHLSELHAGQPLCWRCLSATPISALHVSVPPIISFPSCLPEMMLKSPWHVGHSQTSPESHVEMTNLICCVCSLPVQCAERKSGRKKNGWVLILGVPEQDPQPAHASVCVYVKWAGSPPPEGLFPRYNEITNMYFPKPNRAVANGATGSINFCFFPRVLLGT